MPTQALIFGSWDVTKFTELVDTNVPLTLLYSGLGRTISDKHLLAEFINYKHKNLKGLGISFGKLTNK